MNSLVIYDSNFGNTQQVAEAIATVFGTRAINISATKQSDLADLDILVVGTPIIGWRPTVNMQEFLSQIKPGQLHGIKAATFDTRVKLFIHGDAMGKVADSLRTNGADIFATPMPFYVAGPQDSPRLLDGEVEKARAWAKNLLNKQNNRRTPL